MSQRIDGEIDRRTASDERFARVLQTEVDLPSELTGRLLCALSAAARVDACPIAATSAFSAALDDTQQSLSHQRFADNVESPSSALAQTSRRRAMVCFGALAASISVAFCVWQWQGQRELLDPQTTSAVWIAQLGRDWSDRVAPEEFMPPTTIGSFVRGWQWLDAKSQSGIAWRLAGEPPSADYFFVVRRVLGNQFGPLPDAPPREPQSSTGGRCCGWWKSGSVVYLLSVSGDVGRYRGYLRSSDLAMIDYR